MAVTCENLHEETLLVIVAIKVLTDEKLFHHCMIVNDLKIYMASTVGRRLCSQAVRMFKHLVPPKQLLLSSLRP